MENDHLIINEKRDNVELIISTFDKVFDVIRVNGFNKSENIDIIEEDLFEAKELLIKFITDEV